VTSSVLTPASLQARYPASAPQPPQLVVVVDTEEEFDWHRPFARTQRSVTAMRHVVRAQRIFEARGFVPTYVIDHPVASQEAGFGPLQEPSASGRALIGAHLHPWVNPPDDEEVSGPNSYACNLPEALEARKLEVLCDTIAEHFERPRIYKAGRYGFSATTARTLVALGFTVDTSINPQLRPSADGGPDFRAFDSRPFVALGGALVEVPCTHDYTGWAGPLRPLLHGTAAAAPSSVRLPGILARLRVTERIMLSPETSTLDEMISLTRALHGRGLQVFTMSFHSPSLAAGHTPYVRSQHDLDQFLDRIARYLDFFLEELGGRATTPLAVRDAALASLPKD
jgi:hypothetical protein